MTPLILKRAPIDWNQEDYEVLEDGVVGRVFLMPIGLKGRPWMWAIRDRKGRTLAHGYEPTRDASRRNRPARPQQHANRGPMRLRHRLT
jgi:hypothetical protein